MNTDIAFRTGTMVFDELFVRYFPKRQAECYTFRNHVAITFGSNLTQVPILNEGRRPAFASLNTVMRDTANNSASSTAVRG
jgi:hypothetical protein